MQKLEPHKGKRPDKEIIFQGLPLSTMSAKKVV